MKRRSFIKHMTLVSAAVASGATIAIHQHRSGKTLLTLEKLREITDELAFEALNKGTSVYYVNAHPNARKDIDVISVKRFEPERFYRQTNVMPTRGRWS